MKGALIWVIAPGLLAPGRGGDQAKSWALRARITAG